MNDAAENGYIARLKSARSVSAVVKLEVVDRLNKMAEGCKNVPIFAYEGVQDKIVYYQWIRLVRPDLEYEPYICKTKDRLLQLLDVVERDRSGINGYVYFFLDRDFDGARGRVLGEKSFMTDAYSIENYLVNRNVVDDYLKIEFHCAGNIAERERLIRIFEDVYSNFLLEMRELNFRIFLSRVLKIPQSDKLPERINQLADVGLDAVSFGQRSVKDLVPLLRDPAEEEIAANKDQFDALDPKLNFRGKFALLFFQRWLDILLKERKADQSEVFQKLEDEDLAVTAKFSIDVIASKARPPADLVRFLQSI